MELVRTSGGRVLAVYEAGDPAGKCILVLFGMPNSGVLSGWPHVDVADALGVRLVSYDRPGYGESTPHPGRRVADAAADVHTIADALDIEAVGVFGSSMGGPHALACAALLPELVRAAVVLASPSPASLGGWPQDWIDDAELNRSSPEIARADTETSRQQWLNMTVDDCAEMMRADAPREDEAITRRAVWRRSHFQLGLRPGIEGVWEDNRAWDEPWGFELEEISQPVRLRHGDRDVIVPLTHSELLAQRLSTVETHFSDDTHASLFARDPTDDWQWLLGHGG